MKRKWIFETKIGKSEITSLPRLGHSNDRQISTRNSSIKDSAARKSQELVELIVRCSCPRLSARDFPPSFSSLAVVSFVHSFFFALLLDTSSHLFSSISSPRTGHAQCPCSSCLVLHLTHFNQQLENSRKNELTQMSEKMYGIHEYLNLFHFTLVRI